MRAHLPSILLAFCLLFTCTSNGQVNDRWTATTQYSIGTPPGWTTGPTSYYWAKVTSSNGSLFRSGSIGQSGTWGLTETSATRGNFRAEFGYYNNGVFVPQQWVQGQGYNSGVGPGSLGPPKSGGYDSAGNPVSPGGLPVDGDGNPIEPTAAGHVADPDPLVNNTGRPARPKITMDPINGPPLPPVYGPWIQPGQTYDPDLASDSPFDWNLEWDLGDGVVMPGGGGSSSPVQTPVTPINGGGGSPGTTPPIATPPVTPGSDVKAAVDRNTEVAALFGESARQSATLMNENLGQIEGLLGDIKDNTANSSGSGDGETNEGILDAGEEPIGAGEVADTGDGEAAGSLSDSIGDLSASLAGLIRSYSIGSATSSLTWTFNLGSRMGGSHQITLEPYSDSFSTIRAMLLAVASVFFINALIRAIREAFV